MQKIDRVDSKVNKKDPQSSVACQEDNQETNREAERLATEWVKAHQENSGR
jgi:hypothetical protein